MKVIAFFPVEEVATRFSLNLFTARTLRVVVDQSISRLESEFISTKSQSSPKMSSPQPQAYHCVCSTLILVSNHDLDQLPVRQAHDQAKILDLQGEKTDAILQNVQNDDHKIIVRRDNGFEKRTLLRCAHCKLTIGYQLDQAHFTDEGIKAGNIAYILPGSLMTTETMIDGGMPLVPKWAQQ